jgi:hypothetical protein
VPSSFGLLSAGLLAAGLLLSARLPAVLLANMS